MIPKVRVSRIDCSVFIFIFSFNAGLGAFLPLGGVTSLAGKIVGEWVSCRLSL